MKNIQKNLQQKLLVWFEEHKRDLPWRETKDPYAIWISEVMLQQTTSKAVQAYYKKFLIKFPNVSMLAKASKKDVFPLWAGLGYYKRAENLILAAKQIQKQKFFPKSYKELIKLPGFGPYTSRSVSSLAFDESVGVLDGNVIRFLSRFYARPFLWWTSSDRKQLQNLSDLWVKNQKSSQMNQALMEVGSLICRSGTPVCLLCPLVKHCKAFKNKLRQNLPLQKPKRKIEIWHWKIQKIQKARAWAFVKNNQLPFLKGLFVFPGEAKIVKIKPKKYDLIHNIMHYQIFISIQRKSQTSKTPIKWFTKSEILENNPSSLIRKVLDY